MGDSNQPPDKSESSLQSAFKKRKTQETDRLIEARKTGGTGPLPPASEPKRTPPTTSSATNFAFPSPAERKRTTQTASPARSTPIEPLRASPPIAVSAPDGPTRTGLFVAMILKQRKLLVIGMAVILIGMLAVGVLLVVTTPQPAAEKSNLPVVSAQDVLAQLKKVNEPISNVRQLASDSFWKAKQEIEFDVQRPGDKGSIDKATFTVLGYDSSSDAGADALRAFGDETYKQWSLIPMSNIIVAAGPGTSIKLFAEVKSHMTEYLMAPYLPFLPTATATGTPK